MDVGERASTIGDMRNLLQNFLAPELGELKIRLDSLADGQKAIIQEMHEGFKTQTESRQEMEARLPREIKNSEEKLLIRTQLAEANIKVEQADIKREQAEQVAATALRENEELKRAKTQ